MKTAQSHKADLTQLDNLAGACQGKEFCAYLDSLEGVDSCEMVWELARTGCYISEQMPPSVHAHHEFCLEVVHHYQDKHPLGGAYWLMELGFEMFDVYFFDQAKRHPHAPPLPELIKHVVLKEELNILPDALVLVLDRWAGMDMDVMQELVSMDPSSSWQRWPHVRCYVQKQALLEETHPPTRRVSKKI